MKNEQLAFSFDQDLRDHRSLNHHRAQKLDVVTLVLASVALATTLTFIAVMAMLNI